MGRRIARTDRQIRVATIAFGYADGWRRAAQGAGTIGYEVLAGLGDRVHRRYA